MGKRERRKRGGVDSARGTGGCYLGLLKLFYNIYLFQFRRNKLHYTAAGIKSKKDFGCFYTVSNVTQCAFGKITVRQI